MNDGDAESYTYLQAARGYRYSIAAIERHGGF